MHGRRKGRKVCTVANVVITVAAIITVSWLAVLHWGLQPTDSAGQPTDSAGQPTGSVGQRQEYPRADGTEDGSGDVAVGAADAQPEPPSPTPAPEPPDPEPATPRRRPRNFLQPARSEEEVSCGNHNAAKCELCTEGHDSSWCNGDCVWGTGGCTKKKDGVVVHPALRALIRHYSFQPVRTEHDQLVNIVLVRAPFRSKQEPLDVETYKDDILFLGISSFEDFPLSPPNPFSGKFPNNKYVGLFPGFLHMFRDTSVFPPHVKLLLMSQSDFSMPAEMPPVEKQYDFVFSGTDQDVYNNCVGWSSYAKNWTFVLDALEVMCGEYGLTGVLVATKDKRGQKACTIPPVCQGKILQTSYLDQDKFFDYVRQSKFAFVPQVHDASPRAASQALALNTPVLMNWHIIGGWKYVNEKTGQFFHDMSDFRKSLDSLFDKIKEGAYEPRQYMVENYGDQISGKRLMKFVKDNWGDRVAIPENAQLLLPAGA